MIKGKRGAIELSITTIVVVVIGVTLLALGLAWVGGIFERLQSTTSGAFEKADAQINEILTGSETDNPFIISPTSITLRQGDSGSATAVVSNFLGGGTTLTASVERTGSDIKASFSASSNAAPTASNDVVCFLGDTLTKKSTDQSVKDGFEIRIPIFVQVNRAAKLGTYFCPFKVNGFAAGEDPGPKTLAIDVKT